MKSPVNRLVMALAVIGVLAGWTGRADAQVVVYHVEFQKSGSSINFSFFDEAFFVAEGLGGTGSFIFAFVENGRDLYLAAEDAGEFFFATKPGKSRAVIRATSDSDTSLSHYLALGDLDSRLTVNLRGQLVTFNIATRLDGHVLASDPETNLEFSARDGSIGFAGMATMKARIDRSRTDRANIANQTVAQTIQSLIDELESRGFTDGTDTGDGGDGGNGGDGTDGGTDAGGGTGTDGGGNVIQTGEVPRGG